MKNILIKGGKVIDPKNKIEAVLDVLLVGGKVSKVGKNIVDKGAQAINAKGKIVTPGLIDMHVHAREPGREDKETIKTCSRAAARGGITTCVMMPNTTPVANDQTTVKYMAAKASEEAVVNMYPTGAVTRDLDSDDLNQLSDLKNAGAIAVSNDGLPVKNPAVLRKALQYCRMLDLAYLSHSENLDISAGGSMHEGAVSTRLGLPGIPASSEYINVAREILLARETGGRIHFQHMSAIESLAFIRAAKKEKISITCETCPHYFALTDEAIGDYDANAKMNPPLKPQEHVEAVIRALQDDTIDCITTDHAPHTELEKSLEFSQCLNGIVGLETSVSLVFDRLIHAKKLKLSQAIAKMTINPARILGLKNKGCLSADADADVTIIDPDKIEVVDKNKFESKGRNTPFDKMKLKGVAVVTIVGGQVVMQGRRVIV